MRSHLLRGTLVSATLALTLLAGRSSADIAPPVTGDLLVATGGAPAKIVLVNALGGQTVVTTFNATDEVGSVPRSIVYDGDGALYVALDNVLDDARDRVVRVTVTTGAVEVLVDPTTSGGLLESPTGVDVDPSSGDLLITQGAQVLRADPGDGSAQVVSEDGLLGDLQEIAVDAAGTFAYVVDRGVDGIVRVALSDGAQVRIHEGAAGTAGRVFAPNDIVLDGTGVVAIAQTSAILRVDRSNGTGRDVLRDPSTGAAVVGDATGLDIDATGNFVFVNGSAAYRLAPNGSRAFIAGGDQIESPQDVVVVGGLSQSTAGPIGGGGGGGGCVLCSLGGTVSGNARSKLAKVGKDRSAMSTLFSFGADGTTWSATIDGLDVTGTAEKANKRGTRAALTPDEASVQNLLRILDDRLAAPEPRPLLILSKAPKLTFKTNAKGNKGILSIKLNVEADIGTKTSKGSLKAKLKGATN